MRGRIQKIIMVQKKLKGFVTTALVDGEELTGWSAEADHFRAGDEVTYYFDDRYNKPKMNKPVDISLTGE